MHLMAGQLFEHLFGDLLGADALDLGAGIIDLVLHVVLYALVVDHTAATIHACHVLGE